MMSGSQLTEERIRNWLDSNQVQRERLCIALLSLNKLYSSIRPRRPKGGPDGGRDIESIYREQYTAYGAIGFRNSVSDSPDDKRWVKEKYNDDLSSALEANSNLKVFVFFTNIDLTPAEEEHLILAAKAKGILFVDIFFRERMRIILDSVEGLAARYIYLGIPLSQAEQAAFFERFGSQLEEMIVARFKSVDHKLLRLEFLQDTVKPIHNIFAFVQLKDDYSSDALNKFRVLFAIDNYHKKRELYIGGNYIENDEGEVFGRNNFVISSNPAREFEKDQVFSLVQHNRLIFGGIFNADNSPFLNINELDHSIVNICVTQPLLEQIVAIGLVVNDYVLLHTNYDELDFSFGERKSISLSSWPFPLQSSDNNFPWYTIHYLDRDKKELLQLGVNSWSPFRLEFGYYTPMKLSKEEWEEFSLSLAGG